MIIAIGDIHGEFSMMQKGMSDIIESAGEPVSFVQVGDFGLGFDKPRRDYDRLTTLNHFLKEGNSKLYVIRGNHDNPAFWQWGCGYEFSNIEFVPDDYTRVLDDKVCYFAGGAISVDRCKRLQGVDYWKGEHYNGSSKTPIREKIDGLSIDILFTHDVYHPVSPFGTSSDFLKYWCDMDATLMKDIIESQNLMMGLHHDIFETNPNFSWYHGHYHESHVTNNNGQVVHSLSILEFKEVR